MHSAIIGVAVALAMAAVARYRGRTAWHWFAMSLFAFGVVLGLSAAMLYLANVTLSWEVTDRLLAAGAGVLTGAVTLVVVLCVPARPRRSAAPNSPGSTLKRQA